MSASITSRPVVSMLRAGLVADAALCGLTGLVLVPAAAPVAKFLGLSQPLDVLAVGVSCLLYAAWLASKIMSGIDLRPFVRIAVIGNAAWVVASYAAVLLHWLPLTSEGKWAVIVVAEIVAVLAVVQVYTLRREREA